jgi:hypothetical protein
MVTLPAAAADSRRTRWLLGGLLAAIALCALGCSSPPDPADRPTSGAVLEDGTGRDDAPERTVRPRTPGDVRAEQIAQAQGPWRRVIVPRDDDLRARREEQKVRDAATRRPSVGQRLGRVLNDTALSGSLQDVLVDLADLSGLTIITTPAARAALTTEPYDVALRITAPLSVRSTLDHILVGSPGLDWTVERGVVVVDTENALRGPLITRLYDVRDLLAKRSTFVAPDIRRIPGSDESGFATARTGGEGEAERSWEPEDLIEFVRQGTDPSYWRDTDGAAVRFVESGFLSVTAHQDVLRRIDARFVRRN